MKYHCTRQTIKYFFQLNNKLQIIPSFFDVAIIIIIKEYMF